VEFVDTFLYLARHSRKLESKTRGVGLVSSKRELAWFVPLCLFIVFVHCFCFYVTVCTFNVIAQDCHPGILSLGKGAFHDRLCPFLHHKVLDMDLSFEAF
jgi:hypothetical protein